MPRTTETESELARRLAEVRALRDEASAKLQSNTTEQVLRRARLTAMMSAARALEEEIDRHNAVLQEGEDRQDRYYRRGRQWPAIELQPAITIQIADEADRERAT